MTPRLLNGRYIAWYLPFDPQIDLSRYISESVDILQALWNSLYPWIYPAR